MTKRGNGEGSIYRRKNGRWCAAITVEQKPDGTRKRLSIYARTRKEVAERLATILDEQRQGTFIMPDQETVSEYMWRWLEHAKQNRLRRSTYVSYESIVRVHIVPALGRLRLQQLQPMQVQAFLDALCAQRLAPATVLRIYAVLRRALGQAYRWGLVARNVADQVEPPRGKAERMQALTPDQAADLLRAVRGDRMEAYYTVALTLGLRRGEGLGLRWEDVDFLAGRLRVERSLQRLEGKLQVQEVKTDASRRTIRLPASLVKALHAHRLRQLEEREGAAHAGGQWQDSGFVFTSSIGTPYEPRNIGRHLAGVLARAGLPRVRVHDMRHTAVSLMYAQGIPLEVISEIVGHADKRITSNTYLHVFERNHEDAASRLDSWLRSQPNISSTDYQKGVQNG